MASISPERVKRAAEELRFDATRTGADYVRILVLKYRGLKSEAGAVKMSNPDVISACDALFKVPGLHPYVWFDPFSGEWKRTSANGGWPVGSVKTQYERPNKTLRKLLETDKQGADIHIRPRGSTVDYLRVLGEVAGKERPSLTEAIIWFARNRNDLPSEGEIAVSTLLPWFTELFNLSDEELRTLFRIGSLDTLVPLTSERSEEELAALLPEPSLTEPSELTLFAKHAEGATDSYDDNSYAWTQEYARKTFADSDIGDLVEKVKFMAAKASLVLPDEDTLVERCVVALLTGHLVLQGPPGTGKTTLARLLAEAFSADTAVVTATADWTTYDVIGGLRPKHDRSLEPVLGYVPREALNCAKAMRASERDNASPGKQQRPVATANWLIIDELNRADIDRAIGSLYTVLSSAHTAHLSANPIDLWFEEVPERQKLWMPGKFRLIGTMNDVDTSFVNSISQGLTRRFHFVYVGVPEFRQLGDEMGMCKRQAQEWVAKDFPELSFLPDSEQHRLSLKEIEQKIYSIFAWLRYGVQSDGSAEAGTHQSWPIGSAQAVDLWKAVLLTLAARSSVTEDDLVRALDACFADRIVSQMGTLRSSHLTEIGNWFRTAQPKMQETERAVRHLMNTQSVR
ncbi:AAA family ATPase [Streptomyces achromogenes]|uniref:AAA family ATPase n=1 Tax=Streptomyces achromogenes TaxID=67255 RepID=A0ABZ1KRQ3_STRAH